MIPVRVSRLAVLAPLAALAGCASVGHTNAFSARFADNQALPTEAVVARLPQPVAATRPDNASGAPLVLVTTHGGERRVIAWDVATGRERWSAAFDAMTRPEAIGDLVVFSARIGTGADSHDEVLALDLADGRVRWRETHEMGYVGAAREGDTIVLVNGVGAQGGARRVSHVRAVEPRGGAVIWEYEIQGVLGHPAIAGGQVFIPWDRQNIAVLDARTGMEQARLRSTDDIIDWVDARPEGVFYGSKAVYRLDARATSGTRAGSTYLAPLLPAAPGDPLIHPDGFVPSPGTRTARGRIRLHASLQPTPPGEAIALADDVVYYVYFRYVFAFSADGTARWVRILDEDVIGAEPSPAGLFTVGEKGALRLLDETTGNDRWSASLGAEVASATLDVAGFAPTGEPGAARDLKTSLTEVALDGDNRLVPARAFALQMLAADPDPAVTRELLDMYAQRGMPSSLREAIGTALRARRTGTEFLVGALQRHYDFLEGTEAPPLQVIVPSLVAAAERRSVDALVAQLMDHETPAAVLPTVVQAIVQLGDAGVVPALRAFLVLYHADSAFLAPPDAACTPATPNACAMQALGLAADGIFKLGGNEGREMLTRLAAEGRTHAPLAATVRGFFEGEQRAAEEAARAEATARERAAAEAAQEVEAALPIRLSQELVNAAFAEHTEALRACVAEELARNPRLAQVRVVFIMNNDGTGRDFTFAPNTPEFVACLTPKVAAVTFPRFRQIRQRGSFVISVRGGQPQTETPAEGASPGAEVLAADAPWWQRARVRAGVPLNAAVTTALPWWVRHAAPVTIVAPPAQPSQPTQPETPTSPAAPPAGGERRGGFRARAAAAQPAPAQPAPAQPAPAQPAPAQPAAGSTAAGSARAAASRGRSCPTTPPAQRPAQPAQPPAGAPPAPAPAPPAQPWWLPQQ